MALASLDSKATNELPNWRPGHRRPYHFLGTSRPSENRAAFFLPYKPWLYLRFPFSLTFARSSTILNLPLAFWILYLVQRLHSIRPKGKWISQYSNLGSPDWTDFGHLLVASRCPEYPQPGVYVGYAKPKNCEEKSHRGEIVRFFTEKSSCQRDCQRTFLESLSTAMLLSQSRVSWTYSYILCNLSSSCLSNWTMSWSGYQVFV